MVGDCDVIKCLISNGAHIDNESFDNACWSGNLNAVKLLLENGVNLNPRSIRYAAARAKDCNHKQIETFLLQLATQNEVIDQPTTEPLNANDNQNTKTNTKLQTQPSNPSNQSTCDRACCTFDQSRNLLKYAINHPESTHDFSNMYPEYISNCTQNFINCIASGGGTFEKLYLAEDQQLPKPQFAVKVYDLSTISDTNEKEQLIHKYKQEVAILERFRHPNIITLYGTCNLSPEKFALIMEYANKGSLDSFLRDDANRARLTADIRISIMFQLARSLHFLHTGGGGGNDNRNKTIVLHRNMKPSNIYLTDNYQVKLGGLTKQNLVESKNASGNVEASLRVPPIALSTISLHHYDNTPAYQCPISQLNNEYVQGSDVFSLGVVMTELILGCLQNGQSKRSGDKVFGLVYDMYVWNRLHNKAVIGGDEKLVQDADVTIVWNPIMLKRISKIAVACMVPILKERKNTLDLVIELNQILAQALLERTSLTSNKSEANTADVDVGVSPCWLCNRDLASKLKCSQGHAFCRSCVCELVTKQLETDSLMMADGDISDCQSTPHFSDQDLFHVLPVEMYNKYILQKTLQKISLRLESVQHDVNNLLKDH